MSSNPLSSNPLSSSLKNVQQYLIMKYARGYTALEAIHDLVEEFAIRATFVDDDELVVLNYDQINSPKNHPVVDECRGLILETAYPFKVVSQKFDRFFNATECPEYERDFSFKNARVVEKVDGSIFSIFRRNGVVRIATRSVVDADCQNDRGENFRQMFLESLGTTEERLQTLFNFLGSGESLVVEMINTKNRIVTPYEKNEIVIIGMNADGRECSRFRMKAICDHLRNNHGLNVRLAKTFFPADNLKQIQEQVESLGELEEGFVVYDPTTGKRLKVKSVSYVNAHHARGEGAMNHKKVLKIICAGESEEFLTYFPEHEEIFKSVNGFLGACLDTVDRRAKQLGYDDPTIDQKTFADGAVCEKASRLIFSARKKGIPPSEVFKTLSPEERLRSALMLMDNITWFAKG